MSDTELTLKKLTAVIENIASLISHPEPAQMKPGNPLWMEIETLVPMVAGIPHAEWIDLCSRHPGLLDQRSEISQLYAQYIATQELVAVDQLLQSDISKEDFESGKLGAWGQKAYDRVADLFEHIDFSSCQQLVMVGCGPLPMTLLHILHRTDIPELIAIDVSQETIDGVQRLIDRFEWDRLTAKCCDGLSYDYSDADIVYLANLLSPKTKILDHITSSVKSNTRIILRDPAGSGEYFAEVGIPVNDDLLEIEVEGPSDSHFLSRDVFLRKR